MTDFKTPRNCPCCVGGFRYEKKESHLSSKKNCIYCQQLCSLAVCVVRDAGELEESFLAESSDWAQKFDSYLFRQAKLLNVTSNFLLRRIRPFFNNPIVEAFVQRHSVCWCCNPRLREEYCFCCGGQHCGGSTCDCGNGINSYHYNSKCRKTSAFFICDECGRCEDSTCKKGDSRPICPACPCCLGGSYTPPGREKELGCCSAIDFNKFKCKTCQAFCTGSMCMEWRIGEINWAPMEFFRFMDEEESREAHEKYLDKEIQYIAEQCDISLQQAFAKALQFLTVEKFITYAKQRLEELVVGKQEPAQDEGHKCPSIQTHSATGVFNIEID